MKARLPLAEARAIFEKQGYDDKLRLLNYRTKDYLTVYTLRGLTDYFYGYMVPSTGYLRTFALAPLSTGFVLQFPRRAHPDQLEKADRPSKLAAVFQESRRIYARAGSGRCRFAQSGHRVASASAR